jgi:CspA family cold shock protein
MSSKADDSIEVENTNTVEEVAVLDEVTEPKVGAYIGQCKWFNDSLGYGFLTVVSNSDQKGKDIFVHHSAIKPLNSNYKSLKKGEYVNFDIVKGDNGEQASNVTGVGGGALICDVTAPSTNTNGGIRNGGVRPPPRVGSGAPRRPPFPPRSLLPQNSFPMVGAGQFMPPPPPPPPHYIGGGRGHMGGGRGGRGRGGAPREYGVPAY